MTGRHLILVGLPGVGKSTVGALVASALGRPFVDLDAVIVRRTGMPIARIFGELGESRFRELEREAMLEQLRAAPAVLAPGGGWAAQPGNLVAARSGALVVWLTAAPEVTLRRAEQGVTRPLLAGGNGPGRRAALAAERNSFYARADVTIGNDRDDPAIAAAEIVAWMRRGGFA